jgi:hypothetical protein
MVPAPGPRPGAAQTLDLARVAVTPAEAAAALAEAGVVPVVSSIRLHQLGDALVYEVAIEGRGPRLVDARSGQPISVDAGLARRVAVARAPEGAQVVRTDLLSRRRHDLTYLWGPLPAHRVTFDDPWGTVVYVGEEGSVRSTTRWGRAIDGIAAFHTFDPLDLVVREPAVRKAVLIAIALITLLVALTGYAIVAWRQRGA